MTETTRSKATLLSQLPDNTSGLITPEHVRDIVATLAPPMGSFYFSSAVETVIANPNEWTKALGTTSLVTGMKVNMPVNNRLVYTEAPDTHAHIAASLSMTAEGNQKVMGVCIAKNGVPIEHSKLQRKVGTGTDVGSTALHADIILSQNDYLELWVANHTDDTNITLTLGYLFFMGALI